MRTTNSPTRCRMSLRMTSCQGICWRRWEPHASVMASPPAAATSHHSIVTSVRARAHERLTYLAVRDNQISTGLHANIWEGGNPSMGQTAAKLNCGVSLLTLAKSKHCRIKKNIYIYIFNVCCLSVATSTKNIKRTNHVSDLLAK